MSRTAQWLEAKTPDGVHRIRTSGNYDWIGLAKGRSGRWYEVSRGWSHESVTRRGRARANREGALDYITSALYEPTAPCIMAYFRESKHLDLAPVPRYPMITMYFSDGWHALKNPIPANRKNLRRFLGPKSLGESVFVNYHGRSADFHAAEVMQSMQDDPLSRSAV